MPILNDYTIRDILNLDGTAISELFKSTLNDADLINRQARQRGVRNRLDLKPATKYVFGRDADGVPVYIRPDSKSLSDPNIQINLKTHKDYPNIIVSNKSGYMSGFTVASTIDNDPSIKQASTFLKNNQFNGLYSQIVKNTCAYGVQGLRFVTDRITGVVKIAMLDPWEYIGFSDLSNRLVLVIQWAIITASEKDKYNGFKYKLSLTTESDDIYLLVDGDFKKVVLNNVDYPEETLKSSGISVQDGVRPHGFKGVPIVEFKNNPKGMGDVERSLDTQDINDELKSKASTTWASFTDAILNDKTEDAEEISLDDFYKKLRDSGIIEGDWQYLNKDYSGYGNLQAHYTQLEHDIYESSNTYDPNALGSDGSSPTAFQIKQKMKGLMNSTVDTENQFHGAFREMFRLAFTYFSDNRAWENLEVEFNYTIPEDKVATLKSMREAGAIIPQKTLFTAGGYDYDTIKPLQDEEQEAFTTNFDGLDE